MRKLRVFLLTALVLAGGTSLFAAPNVLTMGMGSGPNLDIHWNAGMTGAWLIQEMYDGLFRYTEKGFELSGATSYTVSKDGLTWTFKLRKEAKWSDGKPVTAKDYVYSMQRLVDPKIKTTYMKDYGQFLKNGLDIANGKMDVSQLGVTAKDDYTLVIQLQNVCAYFDAILCYTTYFPLRKDFVKEDGTGNWAWDAKVPTNGAMQMTYCDEDQEIVLEKSKTFWDAKNVKTDKIDIKLANDDNTQLALLMTGKVDMIFQYPSEEKKNLQDKGFFHSTQSLYVRFLMLNQTKGVTMNANLRKALSLCIDRKYLCDTVFSGSYIPAVAYIGKGFPGSKSTTDFRDEAGPLFSSSADVKAAKQYMDKAVKELGFSKAADLPALEILYAKSNADYTTLFEYLQSVWQEQLGLTIVLTPMENAAMTAVRDKGDFTITPQGWGPDYFDASNTFSIQYSTNFINAGRYNSKTFDSLYDQALVTVDNVKRIKLLQQAEKTLITDDMGCIPLWHTRAVALFSDKICSNVKFNSNKQVMFDQVVVTK
jgi:oligopeptide transport system substrate-binding protein